MTFESLNKCLDGHSCSPQFDWEAVPCGGSQHGSLTDRSSVPLSADRGCHLPTTEECQNVKNIYKRSRVSTVRIGGADSRRNVRPCRMQPRTVQFSDVPWKWRRSETFRNWRQRVPDKLLKKHKYLAYLLTVSCSKDINLTIPLQEIHNIMPVRRECMQIILQTV